MNVVLILLAFWVPGLLFGTAIGLRGWTLAAAGPLLTFGIIALGTLGTLVVGVVGALVGLLIGPWLVKLLFGAKYASAEGWWVGGMVWGAVLLTAMQLMTAVLVARTQANKVLVTWAVVAVSTALVLLFLPGDTILRAVVGLAVGPTVGLVVAAAFVLRRPGNVKSLPGV